MLTWYMLSSCVRPSVCLSQVGVLPRWLNPESCKQRYVYDSPGTSFLVLILAKFWRATPSGEAKYRWGRLQSAIFDQYLAVSQTRCKIRT